MLHRSVGFHEESTQLQSTWSKIWKHIVKNIFSS